MELPITKETLLNFNKNEYIKKEKARFEYYKFMLESIRDSIKDHLLNNTKSETFFIWRGLQIIANYYSSNNQNSQTNKDLYINEFIELVKENFIDCNIISDPLKTYLIIDWT